MSCEKTEEGENSTQHGMDGYSQNIYIQDLYILWVIYISLDRQELAWLLFCLCFFGRGGKHKNKAQVCEMEMKKRQWPGVLRIYTLRKQCIDCICLMNRLADWVVSKWERG